MSSIIFQGIRVHLCLSGLRTGSFSLIILFLKLKTLRPVWTELTGFAPPNQLDFLRQSGHARAPKSRCAESTCFRCHWSTRRWHKMHQSITGYVRKNLCTYLRLLCTNFLTHTQKDSGGGATDLLWDNSFTQL